jgi:hypothetical protein
VRELAKIFSFREFKGRAGSRQLKRREGSDFLRKSVDGGDRIGKDIGHGT